MIVESHAHYEDKQFNEDREELLSSLYNKGIEYVFNIGSSMETSRKTVELARQYPFLYGTVGVHPEECKDMTDADLRQLEEMTKEPKVVAVGEIGLDYYWDEPDRETQKQWFIKQINLARKCNLPMVIHSRDAARDTFDIMKVEKSEELGGVVHCFSYSKEVVKGFLDMGFYIGIGGVVTFNNANKLREVVEYLPIDRILLETDCPYLAPVPNRGKRNSSLNLTYIAEKIAEIKNISYDEVVKITADNALAMYRIGLEM